MESRESDPAAPGGGHSSAPSRSATFAEKQLPATAPEQGQDHRPPGLDEEAAALARQWRVLARLATGVAVLTAPVFFLVLYRALGWGAGAAAIVTALAVFAFRGLFDVVTRRLIPYPSLFNSDSALRAADITARRRAWFWRFWYRLAFSLAAIYVALAAIVYVGKAIADEASVAGALKAPYRTLADQFETADSRTQFVGFAITIILLFFVNTIIFLGPLLYAGIKQIKYYEPGDADWGVRFDDVRGQARPKDEIRKIVALWQSGEQFEQAGGKRERGVLFLGAPGTGKTMLAKAVATGFNCPFVSLPGSAFAQTFIGVDVVLVMWLSWRARRLARKWGGQCIVFIDEIDAVGMRRGSLGATTADAHVATIHDLCFHGPMGALNSTGDLIAETEAWRERLFRERAPGSGTVYPAPLQRVADRVREYVMPGLGSSSQGGLQQLLVVMDGVSSPRPLRRLLVNRINTLLDATYVIPPQIQDLRLRLRPARPQPEQLYFIGACNAPLSSLDPALVRPGRMGRHVYFRTPNKDDRKDIFDLYLGRVAHDPDLDAERRRDELARITMGHSPAMIEQVCSLALTNAHHGGRRRFGWDDMLDAITVVEYGLETGFTFIPAEARSIAIHEAGHAVTGHVFMKDWMSTRLTIKPRGASAGHHAMRELDERFAWWQHEQFAEIVWTLGAMAAERVFYGENGQGVGGDISSATTDAAMMVGMWGMAPNRPDLGARFATPAEAEIAERKLMRRYEQVGTRIVNRASTGSALGGDPVASVMADPAKRVMVAQFLGQAFLAAYWFVLHNRAGTERVADALVERREIYGDEVVELLESLDLTIPDVDPLDEANWPRI
jgi:ATP-dependent Zn protease